MAYMWKKTKYQGIRYREHANRKHGIMSDKYYVIRYQHNGKRTEEALGWATEGWSPLKAFTLLCELKEAAKIGKGAARIADRRKIEEHRKAEEDIKLAARITLEAALDRYEQEVSSKKKSHEMEKYRIERWKKGSLSGRFLNSLKGYDFAKYRDERLAEGKAPNTIRLELAIISHLFTIAQKEWGIDTLNNPVKAIRLPSPGKARERRLSNREEEILLSACQASRSTGLADVAILALETAMRQAEILGIEWANVDLLKRVVHLPETKNGTSRDVPLSPRALEVLNKRKKIVRINTDKVFYNWKTANSFKHTWIRAVKKAGIEDLHFHDLRHEATSHFFEKGLNIMEVAAITGHKDLKMLKRYTHLRATDLAKKLAG